MTERFDATWLAGTRYDELRASDFALFCAAAARDLSAPVPTCPEWDVAGLCDHLARVYQGRSYVIEHAAFKPAEDFEVREADVDALDWVRTWSDALERALAKHGDRDATITFKPESTTMLFWRRRMALETLVHRTDAQLAVGDVTVMDDDLSADGIDELLWFGSGSGRQDRADTVEAASVIELTDGRRSWVATIGPTGLTTAATTASRHAVVRGSAPALLLALSGRDLATIGAHRFALELPVVDGHSLAYGRLLEHLGNF